MMSISELYSSGFRERNRDHFASIVRVALSDNVIVEAEKAFLDRLASNLDISESDYKKVLENPSAYPINPPVSYEKRLERLFDIARMVYVDGITDDDQLRIMHKLGVGLGFTPENVEFIVKKAMQLIEQEVNLDTFKEQMRNMNR